MTDAIGPPEAEAGGILTIDLAAIVANWRALSERAAPAQCAAVVKADGYGCGVEQVAGALAKAGCTTFFVANLPEARRARAVCLWIRRRGRVRDRASASMRGKA